MRDRCARHQGTGVVVAGTAEVIVSWLGVFVVGYRQLHSSRQCHSYELPAFDAAGHKRQWYRWYWWCSPGGTHRGRHGSLLRLTVTIEAVDSPVVFPVWGRAAVVLDRAARLWRNWTCVGTVLGPLASRACVTSLRQRPRQAVCGGWTSVGMALGEHLR